MTTLLPNAKQQFLSAAGVPLAGGSVYFYVPGTTTFKNTWQDGSQIALNTNPVILDSAGEAVIFGLGSYRQIVFDALGNQIWDQVTSSTDAGGIYSGGTSTGTAANQIVATTTPAGFSLTAGNQLTFIAGFTSTGATTLNANGTGFKNVLKWGAAGPVATIAGDIVVGNAVELFYDGTQYQILSNLPPVSTSSLPPAGLVSPYAGSAAPSGWLLCSGQAVSRTTYATLFAVVSTTFGIGDGSTTFNVPDLRGRIVAGADNMGGSAANRLQATTNITTTNTSASATVASATGLCAGMAISATGVPAGTTISSISGTAVTMSAVATASGTVSGRFSTVGDAQTLGGVGGEQSHVQTLNELVTHTHTQSVPTAAGGTYASGASFTTQSINTGAAGAGAASNVVQPTIVLNYIIKT